MKWVLAILLIIAYPAIAAEVSDTTLKGYFTTDGNTPNADQFTDLIDSKVNKPDLASTTSGYGLDLVANGAKVYNVKSYGATGDGVTDVTAAINAATEAAFAAGGGVVWVPKGHYITTNNVIVKSSVFLVGTGWGSWIDNTATSGVSKIGILIGSIGGYDSGDSLYDEIDYGIAAVTKGTRTITMDTAGETSNFSVGDIVIVKSSTAWSGAFPSDTPYYIHIDRVEEIGSGTLLLQHGVPDTYGASATIGVFTGTLDGPGGLSSFIAQGAGVARIRLTQSTGDTSGWYGISAGCFECTIEDVWMPNVSTPFGSNLFAYSTARNINAMFEAGAWDAADSQYMSTFEDITLTRFTDSGDGNTADLNQIGVSISNGSDITVRNMKVYMAGETGSVGPFHTHRVRMDGVEVYDQTVPSGKTYALTTGYGEDCWLANSIVDGAEEAGIFVGGERAHVLNNRVVNHNTGAGGDNGIQIDASLSEYLIEGNVIGTDGSRTSVDNIVQTTSYSADGIIRHNITHNTQTNYSEATQTVASEFLGAHDGAGNAAILTDSGESWTVNDHVGAIVYNITDGSSCVVTANDATTVTCTLSGGTDDDWDAADTYVITDILKSYTITGGSVRRKSAWRVHAAGGRTGTNDAKRVLVLLGSTIIGQIDYAAGGTGTWEMDCKIVVGENSASPRASCVGLEGTGIDYNNNQNLASALASDANITMQAYVLNASDAIYAQVFSVDVIQ